MSTDNIGEKMERAAGNNPKDRGPFRLFKRRSFEPSGRLRPTDEVITEQAARAFPKRPEPDLPLNGAVIDLPKRPSTEPQNTVVVPDQNQPQELMEHAPERPPMSRRTFLSLLSGGAVVAAAAAVEAKTGAISKIVRGDNKAFAPGTASNPTERPATQAPATQEPATQVPTEVPATQAPTEVPATPKPELPLFPEKYNFGANDEYFRQYEGGLFTGVEKGRAEETSQTYNVVWTPADITFSREPIKGLEINDPAGIEKALYIAEALWESKKGLATPEDFDKAVADYDSATAAGKAPVSKTRGLVFVDEPPVGFYTNHNQGFSKFTEKGEGGRDVAEIFLPSETVDVLQSYFDRYISTWCAASAIGMLQVSEPVVPNEDFTAKYIVPLGKKFQSLFKPQDFTLVS